MKDAYHPLLYLSNKQKKQATYPQTIHLHNELRILVISGPNAGGKSITLKTIGLLQLMVQTGFLVPVHPQSHMCVFESILTDIGDNQSIENELSTYSYRLKNMNRFLKKCDAKSLLLIDEFGTGSDPELGGALAEIFLEVFYQEKLLNKKNYVLPTQKRDIGLVVQEKALFPHLNVLENVKFGLAGSRRKKNDQAMKYLNLLQADKFAKLMPNKLSGGEQQRVAIARALAPEPKLLLMDEPFSSLDADLREALRSDTRELFKQTKTSCIIVTHDFEDADKFCDVVSKLEEGQIKYL